MITPYEKLGIIDKRFDPKKINWTPDDILTNDKFKFKNDAYLSFGHIILDQNNIQL